MVTNVHKNNIPGLVDSAIYIPPDMNIALKALAIKSLLKPTSAEVSKAVFVTAADYSHFKESRDSIDSIQKHHPTIYYDLGLGSSSVREVTYGQF